MIYRLSFASIEVISSHIAEIIVDEGVEISLEMCEEYDALLLELFPHPYTVIVNRINEFSYTYEAGLLLGSLEKRIATAFIVYNESGENRIQKFQSMRKQDTLNIRIFSGFDLGRRKSIEWLESELAKIRCSS